MKTTKKLTLNKETIAHLNRTEGRTVVGGYATPKSDAGGCTSGTCYGKATCNRTCPYNCVPTSVPVVVTCACQYPTQFC